MTSNPSFTSGLISMSGTNGLPKIVLAAADGARAEIYLHGAHVTAWIPAGEQDPRLFLSQTADFREGFAIRGGIPVIFPQFSNFGPLPSHGFARRMEWRLAGGGTGHETAQAVFELNDDETTRAVWPYAFHVELAVTVGGKALDIALRVVNPGAESFAFTCALHTYLRVDDIRQTRLEGLGDAKYLDATAGRAERVQMEEALGFIGEVDRIYPGAPGLLTVIEPGRFLRVEKTGFPDVVVWSPWEARGAAIPDLEPEGYLRFLCVEPAAILKPVNLDPGQAWTGTQHLVG